MQKLFVNWLNKFYAENPITFRIFWFLVGWFISSSIIMQVQKHKLNKRQVVEGFAGGLTSEVSPPGRNLL